MSAEKDKNTDLRDGINYTPAEVCHILEIEVSKDLQNKRLDDLLSTIGILVQLPLGTILRFDPVTLDFELGCKDDVPTG